MTLATGGLRRLTVWGRARSPTKLATYRLRSLLEEVANPARADQRDAVDGGTDTVFSHFEQQWSQFTWGRVAQGNFTPGLPQILA